MRNLAPLGNVTLSASQTTPCSSSVGVDQARGQESQRLRDRFRQVRNNLTQHGGAAAVEAAERADEMLRIPL
jgi:hypothetical protein